MIFVRQIAARTVSLNDWDSHLFCRTLTMEAGGLSKSSKASKKMKSITMSKKFMSTTYNTHCSEVTKFSSQFGINFLELIFVCIRDSKSDCV